MTRAEAKRTDSCSRHVRKSSHRTAQSKALHLSSWTEVVGIAEQGIPPSGYKEGQSHGTERTTCTYYPVLHGSCHSSSQAMSHRLPQHLSASSALESSGEPVRVWVPPRPFGLGPESSFLASSNPTFISSCCFWTRCHVWNSSHLCGPHDRNSSWLTVMSPRNGQF